MDLVQSVSGASVVVGRKAVRSVSSFLGISSEDNQMEFWQQRFTLKARNGKLAPSLVNLLPKRFRHFQVENDGNEEEQEDEDNTFDVKVTAASSTPNHISQIDKENTENRISSKSYSDSCVRHSTGPAKPLMVTDTQAESRQFVCINLHADKMDSSSKTTSKVDRQEKSKISVRFHPSVDKTDSMCHQESVLKKYDSEDVDLDIVDVEDNIIIQDTTQAVVIGKKNQTGVRRQEDQTSGIGVDEQKGAIGVDDQRGAIRVDDQTGAMRVDDQTGAIGVDDQTSAIGVDDQTGGTGVDDQTGATGVDDQTGAIGVDGHKGAIGVDDRTGAIIGVDDQTNAIGVDDQTGATGVDDQTGATGVDDQTVAIGVDDQILITGILQECTRCEGHWKKLEEMVRLSKETSNRPLDILLYGQEAWDYYQKIMTPLSKLTTEDQETSTQQEKRSLKVGESRPSSLTSTVAPLAQMHQYKDYKPVFLTLVTVAQMFVFSVFCYFGGIAPIGITPQLTYAEGVKTFIGTETVTVSVYPNVWIGPNAKYWIGIGAMYSPCMRDDHVLRIEFANQEHDPQEPLGCCEVAVRNTAGTTTEAECRQFTYGVGTWSLPACGARASGLNSVAQNIRPCCVGLAGRCEMLSHKHCTIIHGTYHQHDYEHCRQINCLEDVCKMGSTGVKENSEASYYSWHPNQWWRFFLPVFFHNGIIHLLLVAIAQWIVLRPIEGIAGSVRVAIIYFTCVFAGNLMSGIFIPYMPQVGATAAICGFLGVTFIEIVQSRNLTQSTCTDFLKTLLILSVFIISGTLPFVDNFAQIGGFIIGVLAGIIFLPYVVFGRWDVLRRRMLVGVTIPILLFLLLFLMLMFYVVQSTEFCSWCHYLNCVPYTISLCNHTWLTYEPF